MRKNSFNKTLPAVFEIGTRQFSTPEELTLSIIEGKWKLQIISILLADCTYRYGEIKKAISGNITHKMLIQSLRQLETDGLVRRNVYPQVPPRVEYTLTVEARPLSRVIDTLEAFGMIYQKNASRMIHQNESSTRDRK